MAIPAGYSACVTDNFNRADSATLGTGSSGQPWTEVVNAIGIKTNQAYTTVANATSLATVDLGRSDCDVSVDMAHFPASGVLGLTFRGLDGANFWRYIFQGGAPASQILQVISGGGTLTVINTPLASFADGDVWEVIAQQNQLYGLINGVQQWNVQSVTLQQAHHCGLIFSTTIADQTGRLDNFSACGPGWVVGAIGGHANLV